MSDPFTDRDRAKFIAAYERVCRLPSVETQTLEWFRYDSAYGFRSRFGWRNTNCDLSWSGFQLYVRGMLRGYGGKELWVFTVAKVEIPSELRGRGWFRHYLEMAWHTMPHDGLVIEQVNNQDLYAHFCGRPEFVRIEQSFLRISPRGIHHCPACPTREPQSGESRKVEFDL
jgi:hypothetical protein